MARSTTGNIDARLSSIASSTQKLRAHAKPAIQSAIDRLNADLAAARFHLRRDRRDDLPPLVAVLGGTGTGKSTIVNRLLDAEQRPITASSFRRTFTAGPVAVAHASTEIPESWLAIEHAAAQPDQLPAQGRAGVLTIARVDHDLAKQLTLIDTPDLDGDQPAHHAQADRVFRWADAVVFLVTPEKYQMTELRPYYRLAARYATPSLYVMNKVEEQPVLDDYIKQLNAPSEAVFAIARDDSAYTAPAGNDLPALKHRLSSLAVSPPQSESRDLGLRNRAADLLDRVRDQVLDPLRRDRRSIDAAIASLRAMEAPAADVDVSPLMLQLRRRLQQRSVLYLMGPGKMLDRVRQVPGLLARLPRATWDLVRHGQVTIGGNDDAPSDLNGKAGLDFHGLLTDQMRIVQARIGDVVGSAISTSPRIDDALIDPDDAGKIADEELANLRDWLTRKWNATPRDTAILTRLIRHVPGGEKLTRWSEAAPYLLAAVVATHHAFFGPIDLMVLGGWTLATWLTEKLSNEVTWRVREANLAINRRFGQLAHQQITAVVRWLDAQAPATRSLDELHALADRASEAME